MTQVLARPTVERSIRNLIVIRSTVRWQRLFVPSKSTGRAELLIVCHRPWCGFQELIKDAMCAI
jgi:hypothetical protein